MSSMNEYLKKRCAQKQVWIFGIGKEGLSTYSILRASVGNIQITVVDDKVKSQLTTKAQALLETDPQLTFLSSKEVTPALYSSDILLIKTPGIPSSHPVVSSALHAGGEVTSNTQLFFECLEELREQPVTIGVTGTKGKSTTSSMIYHVLRETGKPVCLVGNIGVPPLDALSFLNSEFSEQPIIVLELSSHQLRELTFSPDIAVIQNITPEHLDYYPDFETYRNAKGAITKYQNEKDVVIYCPEFDAVQALVSASAAQRITFAVDPASTAGLTAYASGETIKYGEEDILPVGEVPLVGRHNLYNVLPAVIIGKMLGIESTKVAEAIKTFKGLPHRIEFSGEKNGVSYYNDSQATTPEAAVAALRSFPQGSLHLLAGGSDKGVELREFAEEIVTREVKTLVLFPPMGSHIEQLVTEASAALNKPLPSIHHVNSMQEAVSTARTAAKPGEIVLLSPACASFGLFKNYQDRGDQFKAAVQA